MKCEIVSEEPLIRLYLGDSIKALKGMNRNEYELALVDPPFGIGPTWSKSRNDVFYTTGKIKGYDNSKPPPKRYFRMLREVSKNQIIWGGNYFTNRLPAGNSWIVWDKKRNYDLCHMSEAELAWHSFSNIPLRVYQHEWNGYFKGSENGKCDKVHPHQKPINLYRWTLLNYANPGSNILDTHGGSMSIAIACYDMGHPLDLWELDTDYFKAGVDRVKKHIAQGQLFRPKKKNGTSKQLSIEDG